MNTQVQTKSTSENSNDVSKIVWFEIPADNVERARTFYGKLFGWKITEMPGGPKPYWIIDTGDGDQSRKTRRQYLHGENRGAANGLLRRLQRYREKHFRSLGGGREREIVVLKRI